MSSHSITVWTAVPEATSEELWPRLEALLDTAERARAARFFFERDRRQHVAAHALKRLMLSALGASPPWEWTFEMEPGGKPRVANLHGPRFNLSHCDGLVACAVCPDMELGLDVEHLAPDPPFEIAETHFAPAELRWLQSLEETSRSFGFFQLWTLKEAFVKAIGWGVAQPFKEFAFAFNPLQVCFRDAALGDPRAWRFEQRLVGTEHILALAWNCAGDGNVSVVIREARFETLLSFVHLKHCLSAKRPLD
jgi:4'-phosphopantetheinyl transferase